MGKLPTSKRRTRKTFGVFFLVLQQFKLGRKIKKKQETYFRIFSKFFKHTIRKRENKFDMDNTMKKYEPECNVGGNTYSPKLRILA